MADDGCGIYGLLWCSTTLRRVARLPLLRQSAFLLLYPTRHVLFISRPPLCLANPLPFSPGFRLIRASSAALRSGCDGKPIVATSAWQIEVDDWRGREALAFSHGFAPLGGRKEGHRRLPMA
eukprot:8448340-Pyramimonas_sp.AAC.1